MEAINETKSNTKIDNYEMVTGTKEIKGEKYNFDSEGKYIGE